MVVIPKPIFARLTLADKEIGKNKGQSVELALKEWLVRHGQAMEDAAFEAACRQTERK